MKKTLMALLCLLVGCKELENIGKKDDSAPSCERAAFLPLTTTYVNGLEKGKHYQITIENKVLWDTCRHTSDVDIYVIDLHPNGLKYSLNIQSHFLDYLGHATEVPTRVQELDSQCQPQGAPLFEGQAQHRVSSYSEPPQCGGGTYETGSWIQIQP